MSQLIARPSDRCPSVGGMSRTKAKRPSKAAAPTRKRVKSAPRRRSPALQRWLRRSVVALGLIAALGLAGGAAWLWRSGTIARTVEGAETAVIAASVGAGFALGEIEVEGRVNTPADAVLSAVGVRRGEPLLTIDIDAARDRLGSIGWVRSAAVERRWPDTVRVKLEERTPLALWQHDGRMALVDAEGAVVTRDGLERFNRLPLIVGADAPAHAETLLRTLDTDAVLKARVAAAVRVAGRRWNLRTNKGVDVSLPEVGIEAAWARLGKLQREHGILDREVTDIDLRLPDRIAVTPAPGATMPALAGAET